MPLASRWIILYRLFGIPFFFPIPLVDFVLLLTSLVYFYLCRYRYTHLDYHTLPSL